MPGGVALRSSVRAHARNPAPGRLCPDGTALRVAGVEPAEDGRADGAVRDAVARAPGVPPSGVELAQGAASRAKALRIAGDPDLPAERIAALARLG